MDDATNAALVERAWQANVQAVQDAKADIAEALRQQAAIESTCGFAAHFRHMQNGGRGMPTLNDDEKARIDAARAVTAEARQRHDAAIERFKAGAEVAE